MEFREDAKLHIEAHLRDYEKNGKTVRNFEIFKKYERQNVESKRSDICQNVMQESKYVWGPNLVPER